VGYRKGNYVSLDSTSETLSEASPTPARAARKKRPAMAVRPPSRRSRVTNGKEVLPGTNGNTIWGRRYRDIVAAIAADLGGADTLSEAHAQMVRRYASLSVQLEFLEARLVAGEEIDDEKYARLTSSLVRVSARIGMKRIRPSKDITPSPTPATLSDYIALKRAEEEDDDDTDAMPDATAEGQPDA
jgi:hypothetical protein